MRRKETRLLKSGSSSPTDSSTLRLRNNNVAHDVPSSSSSTSKRNQRREHTMKRKQKQQRKLNSKFCLTITLTFVLLIGLMIRIISKSNYSYETEEEGIDSSKHVDVNNLNKEDKNKKEERIPARPNLRNQKQAKWENKMEHIHNNIVTHDTLIDPEIVDILESEWPHPIIHIVNTRFMQNQAQYPILARARLELFKTFCYSTMVHSSAKQNKGLIWIIKTDPNLPSEILDELITLLKPHDNFFLVASLHNYGIGHEPGAWRGGIESDEILSHSDDEIYTGDMNKLMAAKLLEKDRIILETRLDADDGLETQYLVRVQKEALNTFFTEKQKKLWSNPLLKTHQLHFDLKLDNDNSSNKEIPKWFYWCVRTHGEWFADLFSPTTTNDEGLNTYAMGHLNTATHEKMCVTPGLTVGYNIGTNYKDVPQYAHAVLHKKLRENGGCTSSSKKDDDNNCVQLLKYKDTPILAIRARTPTSAGMMDILGKGKYTKLSPAKQKKLWVHLQSSHFMMSLSKIKSIQSYTRENLVGIAKENLKGQCTDGHSCKSSSKEKLQRIIDLEEQRNEKYGKNIEMKQDKK